MLSSPNVELTCADTRYRLLFFGLPVGLIVDSSLYFFTVLATQSSVPKGFPLVSHRSSGSISFLVNA